MEILVIAVVALIVFGPEKLPDIARRTGRFVSDVRRMGDDVRSEFTTAFDDDEDDFEASSGAEGPTGDGRDKDGADPPMKRSGADKPVAG